MKVIVIKARVRQGNDFRDMNSQEVENFEDLLLNAYRKHMSPFDTRNDVQIDTVIIDNKLI